MTMGGARRKFALVGMTALASIAVLLVFHTLFVLEPFTPAWLSLLRPVNRDLNDIASSGGVLRVAVCPDEVAYADDQGETRGLAYELASRVSRRLGFQVEPVISANAAAGLRDVLRGRADLLAVVDSGPLPALEQVAWTTPFDVRVPVVIGREGGGVRKLGDLRGRTVAVRRNTALEETAVRWRARLGGELTIQRVPTVMTDRELAVAAARGAWSLVIMDQDRARLEADVYRGLEVSAPLDAALPVRWALRPNSPQLVRLTSKILDEMRVVGTIAELDRRYLENPARLQELRRTPQHEEHLLTPFDGLFQRAAREQGLDWRLLAAVSETESGHNPEGVGPQGAIGLMQLMPATARAFGADDPLDPAQNVGAGARHLRWLYNLFRDVDEPDRLAFTLAAYNIGIAHVEDARDLAEAHDLDPNKWDDNVAEVLPLLDDPQVAATVEHGAAHGAMTVEYVRRVLVAFRSYSEASPSVRTATAKLSP